MGLIESWNLKIFCFYFIKVENFATFSNDNSQNFVHVPEPAFCFVKICILINLYYIILMNVCYSFNLFHTVESLSTLKLFLCPNFVLFEEFIFYLKIRKQIFDFSQLPLLLLSGILEWRTIPFLRYLALPFFRILVNP